MGIRDHPFIGGDWRVGLVLLELTGSKIRAKFSILMSMLCNMYEFLTQEYSE